MSVVDGAWGHHAWVVCFAKCQERCVVLGGGGEGGVVEGVVDGAWGHSMRGWCGCGMLRHVPVCVLW